MVAWYWLIATLVAGVALGAGLTILPAASRMWREMCEAEADVEAANAELDASIARGGRRMPRRPL